MVLLTDTFLSPDHVYVRNEAWVKISTDKKKQQHISKVAAVVYCLVTKLCPTFVIPWTVAHQAPLSMIFPRQEYWSGVLLRFSGDLPDPGIEPAFPMSRVLAGKFFTTESPGKTTGEMRYHPLIQAKTINFILLLKIIIRQDFN